MAHRSHRHPRTVAFTLLGVALALTSCGGSGTNPLPAELSVIDVAFVYPNDAPLDPTLKVVPRNTWIRIEFTKAVAPETLNGQTIRIRGGANLSSEPHGTYRADGNVVRFDPTVGQDGTPSPTGLPGLTNYRLEIPTFTEATAVVRSIDDDPVVVGSSLDFSTSDAFLDESTPPRVLGVRFLPEPDPVTGVVPSESICFVDFDEVIDANSVRPGRDGFESDLTFDVRYAQTALNIAEGVAGRAVAGTTRLSPDARSIEFLPVFGFGPRPFEFQIRVTNGITDLAGNRLDNAQTLGNFTCDGDGLQLGTALFEDFFTLADRDDISDADWGVFQAGVLGAPAITSREVYVMGADFADGAGFSSTGTFTPSYDLLIGSTVNQVVANLQPPSASGRRLMYAFSDTELGAAGTISALAWGPDQNATYAAAYSGIRIQADYKPTSDLNLSSQFSDNVGAPTVLYEGAYNLQARANIGNTPGLPIVAHKAGYASTNVAPCNGAQDWNRPLFDFTGFQPWPALQNTFDWDPGQTNVSDVALVLDFDVPEGTNFQQVRGWFGDQAPCSGVLLGGPRRTMQSVSGGDAANPASGGTILNPYPAVHDIRITISRFKSLAQSRFYTPRGYPIQSAGGATYGVNSDYSPAIVPNTLLRTSSFEIEYQAAMGLDGTDPFRQTLNPTLPFTPWTSDINDCDGFSYIRWRLRLIGNLSTAEVARVPSVMIPVRDTSFVK